MGLSALNLFLYLAGGEYLEAVWLSRLEACEPALNLWDRLTGWHVGLLHCVPQPSWRAPPLLPLGQASLCGPAALLPTSHSHLGLLDPAASCNPPPSWP